MAIIGDFPATSGKREVPAHIGFQATAGDNTLHLRTQTAGYDCVIDWGDGGKTTAPVGGGNVVHNYAVAGIYDIKIRGKSFAGFRLGGQAGREKYIAAYSMGKWEVDTLTDCANSFSWGKNLRYIDEKLFYYARNTTTFTFCFFDCSALPSVPKGLFAQSLKADNFVSCFMDCYKLTLRSDIFGTDYANRFNGKTVNFLNCFTRDSFTGTQGTAPELWKFTGLTATKTKCFSGAGNSATSISNYSSIPADWK